MPPLSTSFTRCWQRLQMNGKRSASFTASAFSSGVISSRGLRLGRVCTLCGYAQLRFGVENRLWLMELLLKTTVVLLAMLLLLVELLQPLVVALLQVEQANLA